METPRIFITAVINLRGVSTNSNKYTWCFRKQNYYTFIAMQTYKELDINFIQDSVSMPFAGESGSQL